MQIEIQRVAHTIDDLLSLAMLEDDSSRPKEPNGCPERGRSASSPGATQALIAANGPEQRTLADRSPAMAAR